jgi:glyoxylase-like metal-dependent hydrolase (beta-lactamase superfamily II)
MDDANFIAVAEATMARSESRRWNPDLTAIRAAAKMTPGSRPLRINAVKVAESHRPMSVALEGGDADSTMVFARTAYQIVYPDGHVMLEAGMDREIHATFGQGRDEPFFDDENARVQEALRTSRFNLVTHEHGDHIAGVVRTEFLDEIAPKTLLTAIQAWALVVAPQRPQLGISVETAARYRVFDYEDHMPLSAGMVVIKAAGHTPGSQMVYVQTDAGTEYLFVGDCAWHMDGINGCRQKNAPWVAEDREAIGDQLRWLNAIQRFEPGIAIVVGHDDDQLAHYQTLGLFGSRLEI